MKTTTGPSPYEVSPREVRGYWMRTIDPPTIHWDKPRLIIRLAPDVPLPYVPAPEDGPVNPQGYEQVIFLSDAVQKPVWVDPETGFFYLNPDEYASCFQFSGMTREQWERIYSLSPDEHFSWHTFR